MRFDAKQWKRREPYPPLGTLIAANVLRENGIETHFVDVMFAQGAQDIFSQIEIQKPDLFIIWDDGFNYLTKMCLSRMREAAIEMAVFAKKHNCKTIISSSDSTDNYAMYLDHGCDFVILGEGEETLTEIIHSFKNQSDEYEKIPGLAFKKNDKIIKNSSRPVSRDLDKLPFPAWDLLDVSHYRNAWIKKRGFFSLNMATTRGCPYKCNWCAKPIYGNRYHSHSPKRMAAEAEKLVNELGATHIWMCDDIFGLKPGWVEAFSAEIKNRNLKFEYQIQSRVDLLTNDETVRALAESGCKEIWVGAESGSQKILDAMEKGTRIEQIYAVRKKLALHDIRCAFFLQFGYLNETWEDIELTLKMLFELMPDDIGISVSYPLPGTGFYEKVKLDLAEKKNWKDSDDLSMLFKNTYTSDFYKKLHRYVHKKFRRLQAQAEITKLLNGTQKPGMKSLKKVASGFYYRPFEWIEKQKMKAQLGKSI